MSIFMTGVVGIKIDTQFPLIRQVIFEGGCHCRDAGFFYSDGQQHIVHSITHSENHRELDISKLRSLPRYFEHFLRTKYRNT